MTYLNFNGCGVQFLQWNFTLPYAVYLLLIVILIWQASTWSTAPTAWTACPPVWRW